MTHPPSAAPPPPVVAPADADVQAQAIRLRQFLTWMLLLLGPGSVLQLGAGLVTRDPTNVGGGSLGLGIVALVAGARALLGRGALRPAVILLCALLLALPVLTVLVIPEMIPAVLLEVVLAVALALPYVSRRVLRRLIVVSWGIGLLVTTLAQTQVLPRLLPPLAPTAVAPLFIALTGLSLAFTLLLMEQFSQHLRATLAQVQAANTALRASQAGLETQVQERTAALAGALAEVQAQAATQRALSDHVAQQQATIRALSVPVLPLSLTTLVMPLVGTLDTARMQQAQAQALQALEQSGARVLILDITGVPVVDQAIAQGLLAVVQAGRLLGAEVVLVGIRPEVAQTIVSLGIDVGDMATAATVQAALQRVTRP